jgi:mono/diheme cytochrome c family protein
MQDSPHLRSFGTAAAWAAGLAAAYGQTAPAGLDARWKDEVLPLVETYCHDCHGDGVKKGELAIDRFGSIAEMQQHRDVWKRIRDHIRHRLMPPPDEDQLDDAGRAKLLAWIDDAVFPVDPENPDPGRVTLRRLNRIEYQNTLRDLLGVKAEVVDLIPPDDSGYGFDNIGDVLTLSPAHLERYLEASRVAVEMAVYPGEMPHPEKKFPGRELKGGGHPSEEGHYLFTSGEAVASFHADRPGRYRVTVTACGSKGAEVSPLMELKVDGQKLHEWSVDAPMNQPAEYSHEIRFEKSGAVTVGMAFTNDFWDEHFPDPARRDRNLMVNSLTISGPLDGPPPPKPESHRRILVDREDGENDRAYALRVLKLFARKAFRRPPREGEADRYLELVALADSEGVEHGIRLALEAMLVSPAFLYREEPQAEPDNADKIQEIDEHSLATRLSYFFWSTMPDARLMDLAGRGELRENLDRELDRLLRDPRSREFVSNFTGQWLRLRDVAASSPARDEFPRFHPPLRDAMRRETEMLFEHIVREDLPMATLLDANFTFLNDDLARHYGIDGVQGPDFRKVPLADTRRHGILGHGSFHLLTSYPLRTSPVLRGKYVLENLLDTAPPPPPPNIPQLEPPSRHGDPRSLREQMEKHREDPSCSSCHALMDPIGFGLENFDASGAWRDQDNGKPIDASGELIDGRKFQGVEELRKVLVTDHRSEFHRSVASKLLTYALGRGLDWYDKPALDRIVAETEAAGGSSRALLRAVVRSVPFQYRRGDS